MFVVYNQSDRDRPADQATAAGLTIILEAFAHNLEADGKSDRPVIEWSNQVGEALNAFGSRSTLGKNYRREFAKEFDALGLDLKRALGVTDVPNELTPERRAAAVAVLRRHAEALK